MRNTNYQLPHFPSIVSNIYALQRKPTSVQYFFNNKTDRHYYSALLKQNLQKSRVKKKKKLIDKDNQQASNQIQYHSNTKKKQNMMDGNALPLHPYQINFTIPIKKFVILIFTPDSRELH